MGFVDIAPSKIFVELPSDAKAYCPGETPAIVARMVFVGSVSAQVSAPSCASSAVVAYRTSVM
jgi:hypothetical protein